MRRRQLITLIGGTAAWPLAARAQQAESVRKIGILVPAAIGTPQWQAYVVAFRAGLRRLGWVDGRNVQIAERWGSDAALSRVRGRRRRTLFLDPACRLQGAA
jgi:putative ABC transport system substrate-binding protein